MGTCRKTMLDPNIQSLLPLIACLFTDWPQWLKEEYERLGEEDPLSAPYHYGSHYSNSGTVLHFLVRLPPFTKMFLQYQGWSTFYCFNLSSMLGSPI